MSKGVIYNIEPFGYSEKAIANWSNQGYIYRAGSWVEVDQHGQMKDVVGLIVRINRFIGEKELNYFPNLEFLVSATTGLDHIDVNLLALKGIRLVSLREYTDFLDSIPSTAEHAWALLLALVRNIPRANTDVRCGNWNRDSFRGFQLRGKTIGIIGLGRTGSKVASYAEVFGMNVLYVDPNVTNLKYRKVEDIATLAAHSDVVSLHVHLDRMTSGLLNADIINSFKSNSFLINTSRGKIVDEHAIVDAIATSKIIGVASDVLSSELEDIRLNPLWKAQQLGHNIILTPHIGGATWDAMWQCEEYLSALIP